MRVEEGFYDLASGRRRAHSPLVHRVDAFGWSPDGRAYLMREGRRLVALSKPGFARRVVAEFPPQTNLLSARWEADGRIRFRLTAAQFPRLYVFEEATEKRTAIRGIDPIDEPFYDFPIWSPDGRSLAAVRLADRDDDPARLVVLEPGRVLERDVGEAGTGRPSWSPDGAKLVLVRRGQVLLRRLVDGGTEVVAAVTGATNASLSPDGMRLAVTTTRGVLVLPVDRPQEQVVLVSFPVASSFPTAPTWSPDGDRIVYLDRAGMNIVAADGKSAPVLLVQRSERPSGPTWASSGSSIIFAANDPACKGRLRLMRIAPDGGVASHVHRTPRCNGARAPSWRP